MSEPSTSAKPQQVEFSFVGGEISPPVSAFDNVLDAVTKEMQKDIDAKGYSASPHPVGFRPDSPDSKTFTWAGLPYRGTPYTIKSDDPPYMQPRLRYEVHIDFLELPKDLDRYREIFQKVTDGLAHLSLEERQAADGKWVVLLRWADKYYGPPPEVAPADVVAEGRPSV